MKKFALLFSLLVAAGIVFGLGMRICSTGNAQPIRLAEAEVQTQAVRRELRSTRGAADSPLLPPVAAAEADSSGRAPSDPSSDVAGNFSDLLNSDSPAATFQQVYLLLKDQFVDRIDSDRPLANGAAAALVSSLGEPNSRFVGSGERAALEQQSSGLYTGIGATFTVRKVPKSGGIVDMQITIVDPLPGSPAEKAGLRTGDVITGIDGHWVISFDPFEAENTMFKKLEQDPYDLDKAIDDTEKRLSTGYSLDKAQGLLDVSSKYPLKLEVQRPGVAKPIDVSLDVSVATQVKDVEFHRLDDGNGYISFNVFCDSTPVDFSNAMTALGQTKGLVVDLRDCAGGDIDPAIEIGKSFDSAQTFGEMDARGNQTEASGKDAVPTRLRLLNDPGGSSIPQVDFHGPISVLVNKGTANTAEMLAAFLHDRAGARIVGANTFGDALAQTLFPLSDGAAIVLTTGQLKTDMGVPFADHGLAPQYAMADPGHAGDSDADPGMAKAVGLLALGPVAPGSAVLHPIEAASLPADMPGAHAAGQHPHSRSVIPAAGGQSQ